MSTSDKIIMISERVSNDLALRDIADALFDDIESLKESEIVIDFSEVTSITRSFAHQYSLRKKSSKKNISEINMPTNIRKMFDIVENKYEKTKLIEIGSVKPIVV